jgi:hypothetical protein
MGTWAAITCFRWFTEFRESNRGEQGPYTVSESRLR